MKQGSSLRFVVYMLIYINFCRYIAKNNGYLGRNIEKNQIVVVWLRRFKLFQMLRNGQLVRRGVLGDPEKLAIACDERLRLDLDYFVT